MQIEKNELTVEMLENEYWWGGSIDKGTDNPFSSTSVYEEDLSITGGNQTMPLYISSKGRYIHCDNLYRVKIENGKITINCEGEIVLEQAGSTLRDAYMAAKEKYFPFDGKHLPEEFFKTAQYNTWMEFTYDPTQEGVLEYAKAIVDNGFAPGILIIDEGWQRNYGDWTFDKTKFPDAKKMIDELHQMGFVVMLWVAPYVVSSGRSFVCNSFDCFCHGNKKFLAIDDEWNSTALVQWWNGYSAILDFTKKSDAEFLENQLNALMREYGVDGFKFDGGALTSYSNNMIVNGKLPPEKTPADLNIAWNEFARKFKYHECKNTWNGGGKNAIHRLQDKSHSWDDNGIDTFIPHTTLIGLIGHPFICPDMIGGGTRSHTVDENFVVDQELFVRMAQASVFCPMMQFSWAPWRVLSKENLERVKNAALLHCKMADTICKLVAESEISGEPIIRCMEYEYPNCGYETIKDQFMFGSDILVAPVVEKGAVTKDVVFPKGQWADENGKVYEGGKTITVDAPLDTLPWFKKI